MSINTISISGRLTRDPFCEVVTGADGVEHPVTWFTIANNQGSGRKEKTTFVSIKAWDVLAEQCGEFLSKGRQVVVSGVLRIDEWTDQENKKHSRTFILAKDVLFADRPKEKNNHSEEKVERSLRNAEQERAKRKISKIFYKGNP